jgi:hypothetical protein
MKKEDKTHTKPVIELHILRHGFDVLKDFYNNGLDEIEKAEQTMGVADKKQVSRKGIKVNQASAKADAALLRRWAEVILEKKQKHILSVLSEADILKLQNEYEVHVIELELINEELVFQNDEKEKRAAELVIANAELAFQNSEKEKRALEHSQLSHRNSMFLGRELKMIELKKEINELLILNGGEAKYDIFE